jgi:hypothetical protein
MDLMNIQTIPFWGLAALGISAMGTLVAITIALRARRVPAWILALVPLAGAAAWAAITAPENMVTLTVALMSVGLAAVQLVAGAFGLAPQRVKERE